MPHVPPEALLSRTDDRRTLLLALGAAGVTLAVVLGVIGLPVVNACAGDPRGVVICLRDMADRKFDLPGTVPGQVAETTPGEAPAPPATVVAETEAPAAAGGPLEAPAVEPAVVPPQPIEAPAPTAKPAQPVAAAPAEPAPTATQPEAAAPAPLEMTAAEPEPDVPTPFKPKVPATEPVPLSPDDTALNWSVPSEPQDTEALPLPAEALATQVETADQIEEPAIGAAELAAQPEPAAPAATPSEPATPPVAASQPEPAVPAAASPPEAPLVVANAEPAGSRPPAPTIAAPVVLAPTIDAIELDGIRSFVSGSGPAGALMRLYADGELIGESPVEAGRWLVEGSNLLDSPRRELRVEAIEPDTGKLLGVAAITVEIELPDGGAPPDERPEETPDLGSGVAPAPQPEPAPATLAAAPPGSSAPAEFADNKPSVTAAVPASEPVAEPALVIDPAPTAAVAPEPDIAAIEPQAEPEPLPPLAAVVPRGESASVEILAPSTLQPATLPPAEAGADEPSTITLPTPEAPALIAEFEVRTAEPAQPPGQPVTILRLLPFGDPDEGRYNVGKAIIRHGDTLWSIARRYYGHGIHYRTIFHANRELIRRPSRIFPGQIFDLPLVTDD
ncbi:LysM peptidoglycan-binding domain-containing protein [Devosia sp. Root105]|uniref:LysM peptidoglycan-binding domain-containing protein n=1 Tax=Devosia sp. Root105 TaxID=1736423 RepID=UPI000B2E900F|nr:LysM peptidoglycan-binding domain-containing protein [Devosia sp. Root105]